jgi:hypothetical protein
MKRGKKFRRVFQKIKKIWKVQIQTSTRKIEIQFSKVLRKREWRIIEKSKLNKI